MFGGLKGLGSSALNNGKAFAADPSLKSAVDFGYDVADIAAIGYGGYRVASSGYRSLVSSMDNNISFGNMYQSFDGIAPNRTGYRLIPSEAPYLGQVMDTGVIQPYKKNPIYFSFDDLGDDLGGFRAQIPREGNIMAVFDANQLDDITIPFGRNGTAMYLEPIAKDYPAFGFGGASQRTTLSEILIDQLIDRRSGKILYQRD